MGRGWLVAGGALGCAAPMGWAFWDWLAPAATPWAATKPSIAWRIKSTGKTPNMKQSASRASQALICWLHSWKRWHRESAHLWKGLGALWGVCACSEGGLAQGKVPPARRERFCWPGGEQDGEQLPGGQLPGSGAASPPSCRADTSELVRHKRTFETGRAEKSRAAGSVPRVSGLVSLRAACLGMIYKLQTFPGLFL